MIARQVPWVLKAISTAQITRTIKNEVIPCSENRRVQGRNHVRRPRRNGSDWITLWDHKENAAAYYRTTYLQVLELLARVVRNTEVKTLRLAISTHHKIALVRQPPFNDRLYHLVRTQRAPQPCLPRMLPLGNTS